MPNSPTEQARLELEGLLQRGCSTSLDRDGIVYGQLTDEHGLVEKKIMDIIMAWHLRHAPQPPTRENLSRICHLNLDKCVIGAFGELSSTGYAYIENCVDDLLALFSQGSGKRECPACHQEIKDDLHSV